MGCKFYVGDKVFDKEGLQAYLLENHFEQLADMLRVDKGLSDMQYSMLEEGDFDENGNIRKEVMAEIRAERDKIVSEAKANGTFMKAPNGKPTKLNKEQWVSVRTQRFKDWFGDWELGAKEVQIAEGKPHDFKNFAEAKAWAKENIARTYTNEETGGKGEINISNNSIAKYLSESSVERSDNKDVHLSVLKVLPQIIKNGIVAEQHADYNKNKQGARNIDSGINENVNIQRVFGAVNLEGKIYRVKVTLKEYKDKNTSKKPHSYEATKIELLAGTLVDTNSTNPNTNNSITGTNLLKRVEKSYEKGKFLLDHSKVVDENGEPRVMYHGDRKKEKYHYGWNTFFTDNKKYAGNYKGESGDVYENFQKNTMQRAELLINGKMKKGA